MIFSFALWAALSLAPWLVGRALAALAFGVRDRALIAGFAREWPGEARRGAWWALLIAGPLATYLALVLAFFAALRSMPVVRTDDTSMRVSVAPNGAAARAGVRDGDRVLEVDGEPVTTWPGLRQSVASHGDREAVVTVERDGQRIPIHVTPNAGKIQVGYLFEERPRGATEALSEALVSPFVEPVRYVSAMIPARGSPAVEMAGPVAIVREARQSKTGFAFLLRLGAMLVSCFLWLPVLVSLLRTPRPRR